MNKFQKFLLAASLSLSVAILLGACDSFFFSTPVNPEYQRETVQISWVRLETEEQLHAICGQKEFEDKNPGKKILACATISKNGPCTIYTHESYSWESVGHEVGHCFLGRWHS